MPTTQQLDRSDEPKPAPGDALSALIIKQVVLSLGSPKDLLKIQVRPVGGDRYRVNVLTGKDFASGRIANSFFLTADDKGHILSSTPEIVRQY